MTSQETLLRRKVTGEKGPAIELEPGTYTLSQSFSHELSVPVANPSSLPSPYVPVTQGVPLYSERLGPTPQSWYSDGNGLSGRPACSGDL